jgi:hypothetical protein
MYVIGEEPPVHDIAANDPKTQAISAGACTELTPLVLSE